MSINLLVLFYSSVLLIINGNDIICNFNNRRRSNFFIRCQTFYNLTSIFFLIFYIRLTVITAVPSLHIFIYNSFL
uniref:Uncharacterized protein n=1 Tax=Panstrongylus lignarius TaxID=156445 RepID=A0A224Y571_9HEMI